MSTYRDLYDEMATVRQEMAAAEARGYQRAIDELLKVPSHELHVAADWLEAQRDGREPTWRTECAAEADVRRLVEQLAEANSRLIDAREQRDRWRRMHHEVEAKIEALKADREWEAKRANEAAQLSAEARDQAEDLRRQIEALNEQVAIVEGDRTNNDRWAVNLVARFDLDPHGAKDPYDAIARGLREWRQHVLDAEAKLEAMVRIRAEAKAARADRDTIRQAATRVIQLVEHGADGLVVGEAIAEMRRVLDGGGQ